MNTSWFVLRAPPNAQLRLLSHCRCLKFGEEPEWKRRRERLRRTTSHRQGIDTLLVINQTPKTSPSELPMPDWRGCYYKTTVSVRTVPNRIDTDSLARTPCRLLLYNFHSDFIHSTLNRGLRLKRQNNNCFFKL